jgi:hypothetical protein
MDIAAFVFCITASIILPVLAVAVVASRRKGTLKAAFLGAGTFFVFQILIRIPILNYLLPNFSWYLLFQATNPIPITSCFASPPSFRGGRALYRNEAAS